MKVLLTSHRFWPSVGGTEEVVAQLARRLAARGHDVTVATSDEPGRPLEEARDGYRIRRFALRRVGKLRFPPRGYLDFARKGGHDLVHVHGQRVWSTDYLYPLFGSFRAPIVFTAHGFYQWHVERTPLVDDAYYKVVLPRALRHAAAVTALTRAEHDELAAWGVPDEKLHVVPDGLDVHAFRDLPPGFRAKHGYAADAPLLLYAGGLYRNKRVDRLVDAAAKADADLAVLGRDAHGERARLEALARERGARVRFHGQLPREDVLSAFREADVFALASDFEGFGLVLLEAMASGLPFVATRAGAAPELSRLGGGLSVEVGRFPDAVRDLLADGARRAEMGRKGRDAAARYDWERVVDTYVSLYEEVARA